VFNTTTRQVFVIEMLEGGPLSDFYVELPPGIYETDFAKGCEGTFTTDPEQHFRLTFTVAPSAVNYRPRGAGRRSRRPSPGRVRAGRARGQARAASAA